MNEAVLQLDSMSLQAVGEQKEEAKSPGAGGILKSVIN